MTWSHTLTRVGEIEHQGIKRRLSKRQLNSGFLFRGRSLKFVGTRQELTGRLLLGGVEGIWQELPNGVWKLPAGDGGGMLWSSITGEICFDGTIREARSFKERVLAAIAHGQPSRAQFGSPVAIVRGANRDLRQQLEVILRKIELGTDDDDSYGASILGCSI